VDHLGSTRMLTDSTGAAARRYDYLPFGQELLADSAARTTGLGYVSAPDDSNPKFTGEVRDAETALDWLAIRAVSGAQGRFQSVDPSNAGAFSADPQSWNGYSYVGNNPLTYTDPSGQFAEATTVGASIGGPIGAGIGAAIDVGLALYGILSGGGGHIALPITSWQLGPSRPSIFYDQPCQYPDDCPVGGSNGGTGIAPYVIPGLIFFAEATALGSRSGGGGGNAGARSVRASQMNPKCFDAQEFAITLDQNACPTSKGQCARYVRIALQTGGINTNGRPNAAGDYGPFLGSRGFGTVSADEYRAAVGDIVVFGKTAAHPYGHIAGFDGKHWVSDFLQRMMNPYSVKSSAGPMTLYRNQNRCGG